VPTSNYVAKEQWNNFFTSTGSWYKQKNVWYCWNSSSK